MSGWADAGVTAGALALSVLLGWAVTVGVLRLARAPEVTRPAYERDAQGRQVPVLDASRAGEPPAPLLRGGLWIGATAHEGDTERHCCFLLSSSGWR